VESGWKESIEGKWGEAKFKLIMIVGRGLILSIGFQSGVKWETE